MQNKVKLVITVLALLIVIVFSAFAGGYLSDYLFRSM